MHCDPKRRDALIADLINDGERLIRAAAMKASAATIKQVVEATTAANAYRRDAEMWKAKHADLSRRVEALAARR